MSSSQANSSSSDEDPPGCGAASNNIGEGRRIRDSQLHAGRHGPAAAADEPSLVTKLEMSAGFGAVLVHKVLVTQSRPSFRVGQTRITTFLSDGPDPLELASVEWIVSYNPYSSGWGSIRPAGFLNALTRTDHRIRTIPLAWHHTLSCWLRRDMLPCKASTYSWDHFCRLFGGTHIGRFLRTRVGSLMAGQPVRLAPAREPKITTQTFGSVPAPGRGGKLKVGSSTFGSLSLISEYSSAGFR